MRPHVRALAESKHGSLWHDQDVRPEPQPPLAGDTSCELLIVGGGFHGKSTLLQALERGIYNHIPGDGREYVVTRPDGICDRRSSSASYR